MNLSELDQRSIIALSQSCTEDLNTKTREKNALTKLLAELKKSKLQYDAKIMKKKKDVDSTIVQIMELEKKMAVMGNSNRMMIAELSGLRSENERNGLEVEQLRGDYVEATSSFQRECDEIERKKETLYTYRKEINAETKQRDNVQQDLRASRAAQSLMINRLDDMGRRNRALKTCVANTFAT